MFSKSRLTLALMLVSLAPFASQVRGFERSIALAPKAPKKRMTSVNYNDQKLIWEAAEAKRERKQSRNLAAAGMPQGELL